jgi:hypothetical protein
LQRGANIAPIRRRTRTIAEYLKYTLFMMLALNINAGISPERECQSIEQQAPSPVVACAPVGHTRPETSRERDFNEARIILIDGGRK